MLCPGNSHALAQLCGVGQWWWWWWWPHQICRVRIIYNLTSAITVIAIHKHYGDVMMGAIASEITSLTIAYSTVYSDADQRKHQSSASLAFIRTGEFPAQMASNAENASIWWRHHEWYVDHIAGLVQDCIFCSALAVLCLTSDILCTACIQMSIFYVLVFQSIF